MWRGYRSRSIEKAQIPAYRYNSAHLNADLNDNSQPFFDHPILNSPYALPIRHWELDEHGQPTQKFFERRRRAEVSSRRSRSRKKRKTSRRKHSSSMRVRGFQRRSSNTTPPRSSMKCGDLWTPGVPCRILISGRLRRKLPVFFSIGAITSSAGVRPFFWPSGGRRNCDLADGGCTQFEEREAAARPFGIGEPGRQSGIVAGGAEARHGAG